MHTTSRAIFCTISHKKGQCKLCREVSILYILHTVNQTLCITFCCHLDLGLLCNQEAAVSIPPSLSRRWFSSLLAPPECLWQLDFTRISVGKNANAESCTFTVGANTYWFLCLLPPKVCLHFTYSENGQTEHFGSWMMNVSRSDCSKELQQTVQAMNFIWICEFLHYSIRL